MPNAIDNCVFPHLLKTQGCEAELPHAQIAGILQHINHHREGVFQCWRNEAYPSANLDEIADNVDKLLSLAIIVRYLKQRLPQPPSKLGELAQHDREMTVSKLAHILRMQVPPLLGPVLFDPCEFSDQQPIPPIIWKNAWDEQINVVVDQLFDDRVIPVWFFGDFHQLCVARPLFAIAPARPNRSSQLRYSRGIHYTPAPLVDYLVTQTFKPYQSDLRSEFPLVLDPSCGTGNILLAAFRYLCEVHILSNNKTSNLSPSKYLDMRLTLLCSSIRGGDIDVRAIQWTRKALLLDACEGCFDMIEDCSHDPATLNECLKQNIAVVDFLQRQSHLLPKFGCSNFDFIIGGPPFVRLQELTKIHPDRLNEYRNRYHSAKSGQFDLYMLFVEESLNRLRPGGRMGLSIANTFLRSSSGHALRELLANSATVTELVEFEDSKLYPDAVTQILLLFADNVRRVNAVKHIQVHGKGQLRSKLQSVMSCNLTDQSDIDVTSLESAAFQGGKWILHHQTETEWLNRLRATGQPLLNICHLIDNGWNTGADDVFILRQCATESGTELVTVINRRSKEQFQLESRLLRSIVHGRNLSGFAPPRPTNIAIYPFDADGSLLNETQLMNGFPHAWRYLLHYKKALEVIKRRKNLPWYSPRSSAVNREDDSQLLGAMVTAGRNMTLVKNETLIAHSSVLRVIPNSALNPWLLLGVLNSSLFWNYTRLTMPTMGFERRVFRMSHVRAFPFPMSTRWQTPVANTLVELAGTLWREKGRSISDTQWDELDALVHTFYEIDRVEIQEKKRIY